MTSFGDTFELSAWFNAKSEKTDEENETVDDDVVVVERPSKHARSAEKKKKVDMAKCFTCKTPGPEYMSTNSVKSAPPVPVCSVDCETAYLESKGAMPTTSDTKKNGKKAKDDLHADAVVDPTRCYVCTSANPEYMSTNAVKAAPSVPVCGLDCESAYLRMKGVKPSETSEKNEPAYYYTTKKTKRSNSVSQAKDTRGHDGSDDETPSAKRSRHTTSLVDNSLHSQDDDQGYKSWWLGALAFYDFVYQRHGMWHMYVAVCDFVFVHILIQFGSSVRVCVTKTPQLCDGPERPESGPCTLQIR